jgi:cytochrome oxidase Cu insertion factor (SCO1/SenC/PrrC family)
MLRLITFFSLSILLAIPSNRSIAAEDVVTGRFMLLAHTGKVLTDSDYGGYYRMVTFGYTYCPDICPTTLATMGRAMDILAEDEEIAKRVVPLFISVDPERDTPKQLGPYVSNFHSRMIGFTGTPAYLNAAAKAFKVTYRKVPAANGDPEQYTIDHSAGIFIMGPDGSFRAKIAHEVDAKFVAKRIREIMDEDGKK